LVQHVFREGWSEKMRLFRFLRKAENKTDRNLQKEKLEGGKSAGAVLREIVEGEMYEFGEPWQLTSESLSAVVPVLRRFDRDRNYLVIQEISKDKITVADSGLINMVNVMLKGVRKPVFVRAGTIFEGQGTQSRASGMGVVLEPRKKNSIDVFCVHASHGISASSGFLTMCDAVPRKVEDVLMSPLKSQAMIWRAAAVKGSRANVTRCPECGSFSLLQTYEAELVCMQCGFVIAPRVRSDSGGGWARRIRVGYPTESPMASHRRDNLVANLDEMTKFNRKVEEMLSKIPADLDNQVGVVVIDSHGVLGFEMFDHPGSWRAFSRSIVRNYADIIAKERAGDSLFALKADRVPGVIKGFLEKAQKLSETSVFKNRVSETSMFSGELAGEYTSMGSDVIHLILKRKAVA
jgi:hypothetical protein